MIKAKIKNIDKLTNELIQNFNNKDSELLKIGVVVFAGNNQENNYSITLSNIISQEINKNNAVSEIIMLPNLFERFRIFSSDNYILHSYKNQISNMLELVLFDKKLDGIVIIDNGFYSTLGGIISSIRLNLPTFILPIGLSQKTESKNLLDILSIPGQVAIGQKSVFDYQNNVFSEYSGSGITFSTENLFNLILEIMELTPKNSSLSYSNSFEKVEEAKEIAKNIVKFAKTRLPLKKLINKKSIATALSLNNCLGGNPTIINAIKEICEELELDFDMNKVLNNASKTPVLFNTYEEIPKFIEYGGLWTLIKAMIKKGLIDGSYKMLDDTTLTEKTSYIKDFSYFVEIKSESLIILRGNIAEKFAITKTVNLPSNKIKILGKAKVFNTDEEACNAVLSKAINEDDVIIIKNCGKNCPTGWSIISQTAIALKSMNKQNIIITDGFVVEDVDITTLSCVCPDSKDGNFKLIKDGDEIEIDFIKGKVNADISSKELSLRQKKYLNEHKLLPKYLKN